MISTAQLLKLAFYSAGNQFEAFTLIGNNEALGLEVADTVLISFCWKASLVQAS